MNSLASGMDASRAGSARASRRTVLLGLGLAPALASCGLSSSSGTASSRPSSPGTASSKTSSPPTASSGPQQGDGPIASGTLASRSTGLRHDWTVLYPPGASTDAHLPVAIVLHGMGDDITTLAHLRYPAQLGDAVRAGVPPFAIAAINGGVSFWQKLDGRDAGALVATDFVALLADRGLDTSRLALTGWSMGGWGTLRLAGNELAGRLRAAVPVSSPLYPSAADVPKQQDPQQWMTSAEFADNNPYTRPELLAGLPLLLACGTADQFYPGNVDFASILTRTPGLTAPRTHFTDGGHDFSFWESIVPDQFRFLGEHLAG